MKKKIAIITPCLLPVPATKGGAVETLITDILNENEISGTYDIDVYTMSGCDGSNYKHTHFYECEIPKSIAFVDRLLDKKYRSLGANQNSSRVYDRIIVDKVIKNIKNNSANYDCIIVENMMSTAVEILKYKAEYFDCPVYFHMHNDVDIYRSPKMIKILTADNVHFIAVSEYIKSRILEADAGSSVSVLYNGVDTGIFDYSLNTGKADIRNKLGMESEKTIIHFSGRIIKEKGVAELAEAFNNFCINNPKKSDKYVLNMIGFSDNTETAYEKYVRDIADSNPHIKIVARINSKEMAKYYAAADMVVIPSMFEEPFGMVAIEAMAMGKPVIATRAGGMPELLDDSFATMISRDKAVMNLEEAIASIGNENLDERGQDAYNAFLAHPEFSKQRFFANFCEIIGM